MAGWQFWLDRGGTFTDVVGRSPSGQLRVGKVLSEIASPDLGSSGLDSPEDAVLRGIRAILGVPVGTPLPFDQIAGVKIGTTVATNALLEHRGEPTALVTTAGFGEGLCLGDQSRPDLFACEIRLPTPLYGTVVEIHERHSATGEVLLPLDEAQAQQELQRLFGEGWRSLAIALLHGDRYPAHEQRLGEMAAAIGFSHISLSHQVSPLMRWVPRAETTVVDAYLSPVLRRYVDHLQAALPGVPLLFMQSNGGLVSAAAFRGKDSILSGPAGGLVGAAKTGVASGFCPVISVDMGGTSTDVAYYDGTYQRRSVTMVAGVRLRLPMLAIETVAAGGGSVLTFDGQRYRVGPQSAGAQPGPACYGSGGPLTITDANVLLGKIQPQAFPAVFGPQGDQPLDRDVVVAKFAALAQEIEAATGDRRSPAAVAAGFVAIAIEVMAQAIQEISLRQGHDPQAATLYCFGGAGGQHACLLAAALGMKQVVIHPLAGVLSAFGIGVADQRQLWVQSLELPLDAQGADRLTALLEPWVASCRQLSDESSQPDLPLDQTLTLQVRTQGTDTTLDVPYGTWQAITAAFHAAHQQRYGFRSDRPLVLESATLELSRPTPLPTWSPISPDPSAIPLKDEALPNREGEDLSRGDLSFGDLYSGDRWYQAPIYARAALGSGQTLLGPALITEATGTNVVEVGWQAVVQPDGQLVMRPVASPLPSETNPKVSPDTSHPDPVQLALFNHRFRAIATAMGTTLQRTSHSVNIKERLDFSCALFDPDGNLVANAPHIPVHLGSMGESVQVLRQRVDLQPGDVYALNNPYAGGTHLPDITVISPVFDQSPHSQDSNLQDFNLEGNAMLLGYVASRGHHADVGGLTPGSMPPHSRTLADEGILLDAVPLVRRGQFQEAAIREQLSQGPYPARNPDQNIADLQAQIAANTQGATLLRDLVHRHGAAVAIAYMGHLQTQAAAAVRQVIARLAPHLPTHQPHIYELDTGDPDHLSLIHISLRFDLGDQAPDQEATPRQVGQNQDSQKPVVSLPFGSRLASPNSEPQSSAPLAMHQPGAKQEEQETQKRTPKLILDFTGTSPQVPNNFNAPLAVTKAAVLYVFRTLVADDIPLNAGCLAPLTLVVPRGCLLNPVAPAAVVAGNVETSQVLTDALYGALGMMAAAQGTMNNLTFGNGRHQYYETICGGAGAGISLTGQGFAGASGVQTHMTNSRLTDPEVLEWRLPVLVQAFGLRPGSGGAGKYRGGDGVRRRLQFREPMTVALLAGRRRVAPPGLAGGQPGQPGRQWLEKANGQCLAIAGCAQVSVEAGDVLVIETPGGGGYDPAPAIKNG